LETFTRVVLYKGKEPSNWMIPSFESIVETRQKWKRLFKWFK
jgi:hypothetical protein